jgi:hypothetical protein
VFSWLSLVTTSGGCCALAGSATAAYALIRIEIRVLECFTA